MAQCCGVKPSPAQLYLTGGREALILTASVVRSDFISDRVPDKWLLSWMLTGFGLAVLTMLIDKLVECGRAVVDVFVPVFVQRNYN